MSYSRDQLLRLYSAAGRVSDPIAARVRCLGLHAVCRLRHLRRHGHVGPVVSLSPSLQSAGLPVTVCLYRGCRAGRKQQLRPIDRHSAQSSSEAVFGCLNIRSLGSKLDDLLDVRRDQLIDVLFLCETWHDHDSVALRRLRVDGFHVVDRPRPLDFDDTLATNHGGVAAVAASGVRLYQLDIGVDPASFELLCIRVVSRSLSCVVAVVYRPGFVATSTEFFTEMTDVLDRLSTFVEPVYIVGDFNVHFECPHDTATCELNDDFAAHGLRNSVTSLTHDHGGALDVVVRRSDLPAPSVDAVDVGLSDPHLLRWSVPITRESPSTSRRPVGHGRD